MVAKSAQGNWAINQYQQGGPGSRWHAQVKAASVAVDVRARSVAACSALPHHREVGIQEPTETERPSHRGHQYIPVHAALVRLMHFTLCESQAVPAALGCGQVSLGCSTQPAAFAEELLMSLTSVGTGHGNKVAPSLQRQCSVYPVIFGYNPHVMF